MEIFGLFFVYLLFLGHHYIAPGLAFFKTILHLFMFLCLLPTATTQVFCKSAHRIRRYFKTRKETFKRKQILKEQAEYFSFLRYLSSLRGGGSFKKGWRGGPGRGQGSQNTNTGRSSSVTSGHIHTNPGTPNSLCSSGVAQGLNLFIMCLSI